MKRRRMRYQPSKGQSIFAGIVGVCFCLIGFLVVIPTAGLFGLLWTGVAVFITVSNFMTAAGKKTFVGHYVVEEEEQMPPSSPDGSTAQQRLQELRSLYDQRLITQEEYDQKRQEILDEL